MNDLKVELVRHTQLNKEEYLFQVITNAARTSFDGKSKGYEKDKKLFKYLWVNKHLEPFEFVHFQFNIKAPLFTVQQILRHRLFSKNQISHRYIEVEQNDYYIPKQWRYQSKDNKQASEGYFNDSKLLEEYINLHSDIYSFYEKLLKRSVSRELARTILPTSTLTKITVVGNLRTWLHFISLRTDNHAQEEIRYIANLIKQEIFKAIPELDEVYE